MAETINLRQARKAKARQEHEKIAAANRVRFGTAKSAHVLNDAETAKRIEALDAHRLDVPEDGGV